MRRLLLAGAAVLGAAALGAAPAPADPPPLYVVFRADHTFFAYLPNGTQVGTTSGAPSVIAAGTYTMILDDTSEADMQFDLAGPGVKVVTDMSHAEEGSEAYVVSFLANSTYTYRDDDHPSVVWTFATSGEVLPASSTTTPSCPSCTKPGTSPGSVVGSQVTQSRGSLAGSVSPSGHASLAYRGKAVRTLKAGRYTIAVSDRSPTRGFVLQQQRKPARTITGATQVGKRTRTVTLTVGQWSFSATAGKKTYFLVVA